MNKRKAKTFCIVLILGSSLAGQAHGGAASKAAREAAEAVCEKFGAKTVREGSESLAERITPQPPNTAMKSTVPSSESAQGP